MLFTLQSKHAHSKTLQTNIARSFLDEKIWFKDVADIVTVWSQFLNEHRIS